MMELCGAELCGVNWCKGKRTPLHSTAMNGHSETVQLLLTAKSNIRAKDRVSDSLLKI